MRDCNGTDVFSCVRFSQWFQQISVLNQASNVRNSVLFCVCYRTAKCKAENVLVLLVPVFKVWLKGVLMLSSERSMCEQSAKTVNASVHQDSLKCENLHLSLMLNVFLSICWTQVTLAERDLDLNEITLLNKWGTILWTNAVHPSSRVPQSTWWPDSTLRHLMEVFP